MADPNDVKNKTVFDKHREEFKNEIDYHRYWKDLYEKERKLRQEAEGETTIVKGIGMNSPEMKDTNTKISELKAEIEVLKFKNEKLHNYNTKMTDSNFELRREIQTLKKQLMEVTEDNKKISMQITELTNRLRDANF